MVSTVGYMMLNTMTETRELIADCRPGFVVDDAFARTRYAEVAARLSPATLAAKASTVKNSLAMLDQRRLSALNRGLTARSEKLRLQMGKARRSITSFGVGAWIFDYAGRWRAAYSRRCNGNPGDKLKIRLERGKLNAEVLSSES